jgi:hypothetical protein
MNKIADRVGHDLFWDAETCYPTANQGGGAVLRRRRAERDGFRPARGPTMTVSRWVWPPAEVGNGPTRSRCKWLKRCEGLAMCSSGEAGVVVALARGQC